MLTASSINDELKAFNIEEVVVVVVVCGDFIITGSIFNFPITNISRDNREKNH
jgi:hypothetical protein